MEIREQKKIVSPEETEKLLKSLLEDSREFPLVVTGGSMTPFLVPGRDTVYLSKITAPLKRGDVVLYLRGERKYVLHRIYRLEEDCCTMLGDAQTQPEPGIPRQRVLAVVTAVRRKGKLLKKGSFWWEFFRILWIRMVPLRPAAVRAFELFRKTGKEEEHESK